MKRMLDRFFGRDNVEELNSLLGVDQFLGFYLIRLYRSCDELSYVIGSVFICIIVQRMFLREHECLANLSVFTDMARRLFLLLPNQVKFMQ